MAPDCVKRGVLAALAALLPRARAESRKVAIDGITMLVVHGGLTTLEPWLAQSLKTVCRGAEKLGASEAAQVEGLVHLVESRA